MAKGSGKKRVEKRRFQTGVARGVENRLLWLERLKFSGDFMEDFVPADRQIPVASSIVSHRLGQPT